jgi:Pentapeptide repeats (8 copies)
MGALRASLPRFALCGIAFRASVGEAQPVSSGFTGRWRANKLAASLAAVVAVGLATVLVIDWVPDLLADTKGLTDAEEGEEVGRTRTALLAFIAGAIAIAGAIVTGLGFLLSRSGQITDRFTNAIQQLADDKDSPLLRLGGIYALERIAHDSKRDHPRIMEVLTAYVRTAAPVTDEEPPKVPKDEVQAALAVIKRRNESFDEQRLDLRSTALRGAKLPHADLRGAILTGTNLREADLTGTKLGKRQFEGKEEHADLDGADIACAEFKEAIISRETIARAKNIQLAKNLKPTDGDEARRTPG